jgi:metal-responsive CopG/Arc/MetJ family transcriptional regulator
MIGKDKDRISLYLDKDFIKYIDGIIKKYNYSSRSDFFKIASALVILNAISVSP